MTILISVTKMRVTKGVQVIGGQEQVNSIDRDVPNMKTSQQEECESIT